MRKTEEIREFFVALTKKDMEEFRDKVIFAVVAANSDHILSRELDTELRKMCQKIIGIDEKDEEKLRKLAEEYGKKINEIAKDKKPFSVPIKEKKNTLKYILGGSAIVATLITSIVVIKNKRSD
jgi:isocitrate dehydrogenase kinase/phosphatase